MKFAIRLSGVTKLIMTKTDVMDSFAPMMAATEYLVDGVATKELPYDLCDVAVTPVYTEFEGWSNSPLGNCKTFEELPATFKEYCSFIEEYLGTRISHISNGTGRDQLIVIS